MSPDARPRAQPADLAAVAIGQAEIEDDEVGRLERRPAQRIGAGLGVLHGEAVELEAGAQKRRIWASSSTTRTTGSALIIGSHPGWLSGVANGRWIDTVLPWSAPRLMASILPPLAPTKALAIHGPRPEPEVAAAWRAPRKKRSPSCACSSPVSPMPRIVDPDSTTSARVAFAATVIGEPAGEYLAARCRRSARTPARPAPDRHRRTAVGVHVERDVVAGQPPAAWPGAELTMSCGSIHSCRGLICWRLIRVASSRFWMSPC